MSFNDPIITAALLEGYGQIRCSMTGAVIATIETETMDKAIDYIRFESPFLDDDKILDKLEMRWLIQSARPASHLISFESYESYRWLYQNHPKDLLAILLSRMFFEHSRFEREKQTSEFLATRLRWLIDLQNSEDFQRFDSQAQELLDKLVTIDATHSLRNALRSQELKDDAKLLRSMDSIDFKVFMILVDKVQDAGMRYLARAQYAPQGNRQSLSAALVSQGLTPEQIVREEEAAAKATEARRRAIAAVNSRNADKNGKVTIRRGEAAVVSLAEVGAVIPAKLAEKYAAALEKNQNKKSTKSTTGKASPKKVSKAVARFAAFTDALDNDFKL